MLPHMLLASILLALGGVAALNNAVDTRSHARDLHKRAEIDCGTWVMQCGGVSDGSGASIEDVCNNACFYQKYMRRADEGSYVATYRKGVDNDRNRAHSGCQVNGKSICTSMPFSQKLADGFNLNRASCEEFPMADWMQDDFTDDNPPRNALRCVEGRQNSAAGSQWLSFRQGSGQHPKRTCDGAMEQDNTDYTFKIEMNLDNSNPDLLGYCHATPPDGPSHIDPGEFLSLPQDMRKLSFPNGANNFPLKDTDNEYVTTAKYGDTARVDSVWQCRLQLFRQTGDEYMVGMYDAVSGQKVAEAFAGLHNDGDEMVLRPTESKYSRLIVIRTGEMGKGGTPGSRIDFISAQTDDRTNLLHSFAFSTESQGWDTRFKKAEGSNPEKGFYCDVPNIDDSSENGPTQAISCYYPCNIW